MKSYQASFLTTILWDQISIIRKKEKNTWRLDNVFLNNQGVTESHFSIQFGHSVVSGYLWPQGLQHAGLPVHHQLLEFTQTHIHWAGDAVQPSSPLLSPSIPAFSLFQKVSSSHQVAKVLKFQHQSFQWIFRTISFRKDWFDLPTVKGTLKSLLQQHNSKHQFFGTQLSLDSNSHSYTWQLEKP